MIQIQKSWNYTKYEYKITISLLGYSWDFLYDILSEQYTLMNRGVKMHIIHHQVEYPAPHQSTGKHQAMESDPVRKRQLISN